MENNEYCRIDLLDETGMISSPLFNRSSPSVECHMITDDATFILYSNIQVFG